ncbi:MAG: hypothetical protein PCALPYG88_7179 [uncultured Paraburkholderia sp.]|uniref:H-NS histone family protein n=1 Tax=uncultured Paraburkholderia sp. TaxID=1822466 RepID=UPI002596FA7C|nr:H-NS histone family protein [uncultured Paraburkholderia sp.]CAH2904090.1 MAG: hypothetical protein PCALPYG08_7194 [uncultured Paraburkholderia sp.]CAH2942300.1 MAG: hypothetical protein PCALPYG88_7179 [uncultured Paraburkholderia sp.]
MNYVLNSGFRLGVRSTRGHGDVHFITRDDAGGKTLVVDESTIALIETLPSDQLYEPGTPEIEVLERLAAEGVVSKTGGAGSAPQLSAESLQFWVQTSDRCNLACTYCYIDAYMSGRKSSGKVGNKPLAPPAMYRDPKTGATWSGRGRAPGWIARAKDRSKYSVERDAVIGATVKKTLAKAGNYVRGPQPALYADPKTGATWSGRGRAPAWIANEKDRSRFLIAGPTEDKAEPKTTVVKKAAVAAKKTVGKKVATKKPISEKSIGERISAAMKKAPAK